MQLTSGLSLLHYRLVERVGEGGMGVVWRATDTSLGRDAAVKFLPDAFSADPERLARFEREAKLLASLSHPNIAAVYGLHVVEGHRFLAMEMVRGEDLAMRLSRGPIPVDEALAFARQIADALETAHENGVIHRDLKPANVRVMPDGTVKVLDFGLAKAVESAAMSASGPSALSPTVTTAGSVMGLIVGTAAYMSPEQARGKPVDRRTDIWAFGCVLYEMLTGRRPFEGETVSDSIGKILHTEPDPALLPPGTPRAVRDLIARCLVKDAKSRLRDIGDARLALEDAAHAKPDETAAGVATAAPPPAWKRALPWVVAAAGIAAALLSLGLASRGGGGAGPPRTAKYFALNFPAGMIFTDQSGDMAVAPDGQALAAVASGEDGANRLYLRRFDDPTWHLLPGTEGAYFPFWSADSRYLGFFASDKLKKVAVGGGTAEAICDAAAGRGGSWSRDGVIVFAPGSSGGLMQVRAEGGAVTPATELDASHGEIGHRFPRFLPDGKHFMFATVPAREDGHDCWLATLGSKDRSLIVHADGVPTFAPPDRLVYRRNKTLFVQTYDPATGKLSGEPRAIVDANLTSGYLASPASSASTNGVLAFVPLMDQSTTLTWFTLEGVQGESLAVPAGEYTEVRISPDGSRALTSRFEANNPLGAGSDLWLVDLGRKSGSRITFDPQFEFAPVWSPDGRSIYFNGNKTGGYLIYRLPADSAGTPLAISKPMGLSQRPDDISPDGRLIVFEHEEPSSGFDLWILDASGGKPPTPYLNTNALERDARISPDGRWLAYISNENGHDEVYVQSFPVPGSKVQVSNDGARNPVWERDGKKLFFIAPDQSLMAAGVTMGGSLRVEAPVKQFRFPRNALGYDVSPDGKRLLATIPSSDAGGRSIAVILDWDAPK